MKLQMTDGDIITSFRQAADKKAQVQILADLNVISVSEMEQHLAALGLIDPPARPSEGIKISNYKLDELRAMELFKEGLSDLEMAETLGCSKNAVVSWRAGMRLTRPRGGAQRKKKEPAVPAPKNPREQRPAPAAASETHTFMTVDCLRDIFQDLAKTFPGAPVYLGGSGRVPPEVTVSTRYSAGGAETVICISQEGCKDV